MTNYFKWLFTRWYFYAIFVTLFFILASQQGGIQPLDSYGVGGYIGQVVISGTITSMIGGIRLLFKKNDKQRKVLQ